MQQQVIKGYRLSPQQRRLWSAQPSDSPLLAHLALRLLGPLSSDSLHLTLLSLALRHLTLRTLFLRSPGIRLPIQLPSDLPSLAFDTIALPHTDPVAAVKQLMKQLEGEKIDLEHGPVVRARLAVLGPADHLLVVSMPSLCADAKSLMNFAEELASGYELTVSGKDIGEMIGEEPVNYIQFSEWQNRLLEQEDAEEGRAFWSKLDPASFDALRLPFETDPQGAVGFKPARVTDRVAYDVAGRIIEAANRYGVEVSDFLLACWHVLLWRLTSEERIVVGVAADGRDYEMLDGALGLFARWVPVRCDFRRGSSFSETLKQVADAASEARDQQDYFAVEDADGESSRLFAAGFEFSQRPQPVASGDVLFSVLQQAAYVERFKLSLVALREEKSISIEIHYDPQIFRADDMNRLSGQLLMLIDSAAARPESSIQELEILPPGQRRQLLGEFNASRVEYTNSPSINHLFEQQAALAPKSIALVYEDQQLTYQELNTRANRIANHLQSLGAGPESVVAIYLERSQETIAAILGILKSGAAYLPLDPGQPKQRIASMLAQSHPVALITEQHMLEALPEHDSKVLCLDSDREVINRAGDSQPHSHATVENLAYVIFTSGSTGEPKGVAVEHRELLNYVNTVAEKIGLPAGSSYATVSTIAADLGNTAIFTSLCTGGVLHLISHERASDAAALGEYFRRHEVDCLKIVPSHLAALLASSHPELLLPRKRLILGGEASRWELISTVQSLAPDCTIINHYGPTEATVGALTYRLTSARACAGAQTVPLGRPVANTQVYLLGPNGQPVPLWIPGELYIGGAGVARGYLNQPLLTAERFLPDPFSSAPGSRLYRTGDLARFLSDGNIEFLGRLDHQVKIRGFRIELTEIEAALVSHPDVREAVVIASRAATADIRLVAYVVAGEGVSVTELREHVVSKVPDYMVPAAFVKMDRLPLTANGKLDRNALPEPEQVVAASDPKTSEPSTPFEEILANIWSELLHIDNPKVNQSFFDLGGHSLLATQLISRVRDTFKVDIPLRSLFEAPTIARMAEKTEALIASGRTIESSKIKRAPREGGLPLSFAQQRLWFIDQLEPGNPSYNIPKAVRLAGPLNKAAFEQSLGEIMRRHEVLRTSFQTVDHNPVQSCAPFEPAALAMVDLSGLPQENKENIARRLAAQEASRPFSLNVSPLARFSLLRLNEQEHAAIVTMHHIVSDAWSTGIFVEELASLYESSSRGKPSSLAELPIQYADFALWQRQSLQGAALAPQLDYWKRCLEGAPQVLSLPTDRPRPSVQTFSGASVKLALGKDISDALAALSRREGATLFMTLLAAFKTLLHYYSKQDDMVLGIDVANRNQSETENLIGYFANQLVLRADLSGDPTFRELLARVREVTLGAYAHQDLSFDKLVEALKTERNLKYSPLFQVKFVYQNVPMPQLELAGLKLSQMDFPSEVTKFDLTLFLNPSEQGVRGWLEYNTDIFKAETIVRMLNLYERLLEKSASQPDARLSALEQSLDEAERERREIDKREREQLNFNRFKTIKPKALSLRGPQLIKTGYLREGETLPLVIEPAISDLHPAEWAINNRSQIEADLLKHGAILFRGFNIKSVADFEAFARAICSELFAENGELPRSNLGGKVYTPVEYPAEKPILWHNENTFHPRWPGKILFFCIQPAAKGGETPIADSRKVFQMIDPEIREKFSRKKIMYLRNYGDGLGLTWQAVFQTTRRSDVEDYCRKHSIRFEWKDNDLLRTRAVRPAVILHPKTGEAVWFNQATHWHISCLGPDVKRSLESLFNEEDLPRHCYYGDGSAIEDSVMEHVCDVFRKAEVCFPWQASDVMLIDNMLAAHARNPYVGPRKIAVAMGEMTTDIDLEQ